MSRTVAEYRQIAERAGFSVFCKDDWWWVRVPTRPRRPANNQGAFKDETRAWLAAASLALQDDDV